MTAARLTLLESQHCELIEFLDSHPEGHERAAVVLFRRLRLEVNGLQDSDRYLASEVIPIPQEWINSSSPTHYNFKLAPFRELFRRCEEERLVFGFVHNHPTGYGSFSAADDQNEVTLLKSISNRNGKDITFVSMLWANDLWHARVRSGRLPEQYDAVRHILVTSQPLRIFGNKIESESNSDIHARSAAAFGQAFVDQIKSLRVAIVGNGGTGSPLATLAARSGVGEIVLIDDDTLEASNLNRVRGLRASDVGAKKSVRLKKWIDSIGLQVNVAAFDSKVDECPEALDALASCDVIFGCTDDFAGREVLTQSLYTYAQILIDMGLGGKVLADQRGEPILRYHFGRISTVLPEAGQCLFCQRVISQAWIQAQLEKRANPSISNEELKEKYLESGGEEAPGVGPFTSSTADWALTTLFDLIRPFRRFPQNIRRDIFQVNFVNMELSSHETNQDPDCQYCAQRRFLLMREQYRLQRPALGRRDEHV